MPQHVLWVAPVKLLSPGTPFAPNEKALLIKLFRPNNEIGGQSLGGINNPILHCWFLHGINSLC